MTTSTDDELSVRLRILKTSADAYQYAPLSLNMDVMMANLGRALDALEAVLAIAAKHEHGATRWEDPLPVPSWIPELREAISERMLRAED